MSGNKSKASARASGPRRCGGNRVWQHKTVPVQELEIGEGRRHHLVGSGLKWGASVTARVLGSPCRGCCTPKTARGPLCTGMYVPSWISRRITAAHPAT